MHTCAAACFHSASSPEGSTFVSSNDGFNDTAGETCTHALLPAFIRLLPQKDPLSCRPIRQSSMLSRLWLPSCTSNHTRMFGCTYFYNALFNFSLLHFDWLVCLLVFRIKDSAGNAQEVALSAHVKVCACCAGGLAGDQSNRCMSQVVKGSDGHHYILDYSSILIPDGHWRNNGRIDLI